MAFKATGLLLLLLFFAWVKFSQANDFPSLLVANATMGTNIPWMFYLKKKIFSTVNSILFICYFTGVIIDHEYLGEQYEKTFEVLKDIIERVIREDLRGAGLNVKYYSWSKINFNKGNIAFFCNFYSEKS